MTDSKSEFLSEKQVLIVFKRADLTAKDFSGQERWYATQDELLCTALTASRNAILSGLENLSFPIDSDVLAHLHNRTQAIYTVENMAKLQEIQAKAEELGILNSMHETTYSSKMGADGIIEKTMLTIGPLSYSKSKEFLGQTWWI